MKFQKPSRPAALIKIFSHPLYIIVAAASASAFFYLFRYIVSASNYGVFLYLGPIYLVYLLVATSGVLFSISVFAIVYSLASRRTEASSSIISILLPSIGGLVAGCACAFPLIASILLFVGINTFEAAGLISSINSYQVWIMLAMVAINLGIIYYYLGRFNFGKREI